MTGKSMLLEVLGNYGLGVEFGDPYRFQVKEEEGPTDKIASYTFFTRDIQRFPCPITFIDTPGFQRGRPEDDRMLMNEIRAFIDRYHKQGIQAVIYVVPGSQARLTAEQKKVLGNMAEVLGDESASIPFLFCTFADSKRLPVLESVREAGLRYQKHFVVNSSSYFANEEDEDEPSTDDEEERMKAKTSSINELLWKVTTENIQEFIRILLTRLIGVVPPPPPPPSIFTRLCDWISRNIKSEPSVIAMSRCMRWVRKRWRDARAAVRACCCVRGDGEVDADNLQDPPRGNASEDASYESLLEPNSCRGELIDHTLEEEEDEPLFEQLLHSCSSTSEIGRVLQHEGVKTLLQLHSRPTKRIDLALEHEEDEPSSADTTEIGSALCDKGVEPLLPLCSSMSETGRALEDGGKSLPFSPERGPPSASVTKQADGFDNQPGVPSEVDEDPFPPIEIPPLDLDEDEGMDEDMQSSSDSTVLVTAVLVGGEGVASSTESLESLDWSSSLDGIEELPFDEPSESPTLHREADTTEIGSVLDDMGVESPLLPCSITSETGRALEDEGGQSLQSRPERGPPSDSIMKQEDGFHNQLGVTSIVDEEFFPPIEIPPLDLDEDEGVGEDEQSSSDSTLLVTAVLVGGEGVASSTESLKNLDWSSSLDEIEELPFDEPAESPPVHREGSLEVQPGCMPGRGCADQISLRQIVKKHPAVNRNVFCAFVEKDHDCVVSSKLWDVLAEYDPDEDDEANESRKQQRLVNDIGDSNLGQWGRTLQPNHRRKYARVHPRVAQRN
ncbi:unnamed protein product [Darwinula stevensoni]|uniref:G domain-containing protein n=1 Tax=Darwinula stevensoni TaxID=69355 RepID=A0A7R8X7X5_9CRUS|nr:unnamed protein product [Darwinula stevensoni]CAG0888217.1 unnamed protein product [Darwinula stevensoni]